LIPIRFGYRLAAITALAFICRVIIAYNGGIWADEGSFLNVIAAPSWSSMIEFLRLHESHPPLFYILMRAWATVTGGGDRAMMLLPVLLGTSIVPAMYLATRKIFSERVGLYAAFLGAASAPLAEHASQLRPYGLLSLLAFLSTAALSLSLTRNSRRYWVSYSVATCLMLYTHNWGWLIFSGQCAAAFIEIVRTTRSERKSISRNWILSLAGVIVLFAPWFPALIYQSQHAGHGSLDIEGPTEALGYLLFSLFKILETLLLGHLSSRTLVAIVGMIAAVLAFLFVTRLHKAKSEANKRQILEDSSSDAVNLRVMLLTSAFALLAAVIISPVNNLLLPRGIATVVPMLLLVGAWWIDRVISGKANLSQAQLASVLISFGIAASLLELLSLARTERSNVREIAGIVESRLEKNDLIVMAPEWFAASFDHYFPPSVEQIDFPYEGRSSLINFADVWESRQNSTAVLRLMERVSNARRSNRRLWLVVERRYQKEYDPEKLARAYRHRQPGAMTVQTVKNIQSRIQELYGPPRTVFETADPKPIHDELLAFLFVPGGDSPTSK